MSRGTLPTEARPALLDLLLPGDFGRRGSGGIVRGTGGAADFQFLSRIALGTMGLFAAAGHHSGEEQKQRDVRRTSFPDLEMGVSGIGHARRGAVDPSLVCGPENRIDRAELLRRAP